MDIPWCCVSCVTFNPLRSELAFANNAPFLHTCIECAVNYDRVCTRGRMKSQEEVNGSSTTLSRLY